MESFVNKTEIFLFLCRLSEFHWYCQCLKISAQGLQLHLAKIFRVFGFDRMDLSISSFRWVVLKEKSISYQRYFLCINWWFLKISKTFHEKRRLATNFPINRESYRSPNRTHGMLMEIFWNSLIVQKKCNCCKLSVFLKNHS